ncbi:hypothetical protein [Geomicrobium sp. JCM 19039]|uniref:hypothetical protein n=1 Tax=Geomicrobium sp. JCM 19039 TaxID=1460636 RepID=UPI00045F4451|nr:hypothetical protein [Geomicrobium sp. JCM 19039]GAK11369.1 phage-like element PBSX protein XkdB [Geomicrobium sp. JCM 19039]
MPETQEQSHPFYTYTGLLTPEHYKQIGNAIWLFLWCVSSTTTEVERDGVLWGIVKGNKPHKLNDLATLFDVSEKTVSRWIKDLEKHNYLYVKRAPYGLIFTVKNSKRGFKKRTDKNVHSLDEKRSDNNVSSDGEQTNLSGRDRTDLSKRSDTSVRCNKDELRINQLRTTATNMRAEESDGVPTADHDGESVSKTDEISHTSADPVRTILEKYIQLRGTGFMESSKDFTAAQEIVGAGVKLDDALKWLQERFDTYSLVITVTRSKASITVSVLSWIGIMNSKKKRIAQVG